MIRAAPRTAGFTLIELLVALALVGLVVVGAYETLRTAMRGWDGAEERTRTLSAQRTAERFVRSQIEQAASVVVRTRGRARMMFDGTASALTMYAELPPHLGAGLHELRLAFETGDEGRLHLAVRHRPAVLGENAQVVAEPVVTVLVDGLAGGRFEYYGPAAGARADTVARWWPDWRDSDRLPRLVRVRWEREGEAPWPDVVVAPRSDGVRVRIDPDEEEEEEEEEQEGPGDSQQQERRARLGSGAKPLEGLRR